MAYTKTNWVNDQTELNAENMNHIEDGIYNSQNVEIIAISDTAPTSCVTGDKYYNTEDNLIYTATGTNTWGEDGEEPIRDVFYILFSEQSSYSYDGTTLVSVGGGTEDIIISDEEPTSDDWKIWIDTGEISQQASEITNSYSTSTGIGYSANYINNKVEPSEWVSLGNTVYYKKCGNIVTVRGYSTGTVSLTQNDYKTLGTLPSGYKPSMDLGFPFTRIGGTDPVGIVRIKTDGVIDIYSTTADSYWAFTMTFIL